MREHDAVEVPEPVARRPAIWPLLLIAPVTAAAALLASGYEHSATVAERFVPLAALAAAMILVSVAEAFAFSRGPTPARRGVRWGRRTVRGLAWGVFLVAALDRTFVPARARWNAVLARNMFDLSAPHVCRLMPETPPYALDANNVRHSVRVNRQGFRGRDFVLARARPDDLRVAIFGDSLVFGIGVDQHQTLAVQLEAALRAELPGRGVEVMNFGVPCTTIVTAASNALHAALPYQPDAMVFSMSTNLAPFDICARLRQIERSRVLRWMITWPRGIELVNSLQQRVFSLGVEEAAQSRTLAALTELVPVQRREGFVLAFFQFWNGPGLDETLRSVRPPELDVLTVRDGTDFATYTQRWAIPGDGHPTVEGQRHYAGMLARALAPRLRARRLQR